MYLNDDVAHQKKKVESFCQKKYELLLSPLTTNVPNMCDALQAEAVLLKLAHLHECFITFLKLYK